MGDEWGRTDKTYMVVMEGILIDADNEEEAKDKLIEGLEKEEIKYRLIELDEGVGHGDHIQDWGF